MDLKEKALALHRKHKGKLRMVGKMPVNDKESLSLAYSPGVAEPCKEIAKDPEAVYEYTGKGNTVAIISDGSAVLGLGNIGPKAALPVMEGKALLLHAFSHIDAIPLCLDTQDTDEIIRTCQLLAPSLGAINLEDISAPRCVTIERALYDTLDIPVFHDDQHGTAIVVTAALINACKLLKKDIHTLHVALCGTGAAGSSIARMLKHAGVKSITAINREGVIKAMKFEQYDFLIQELLQEGIIDTAASDEFTLSDIMKGRDVFIGVSIANLVTPDMIRSMAKDPIVFPMANPDPEIMPHLAIAAGASVVGTGRSDFPNQINNVLAFPGIFRGALDAKATKITQDMKNAASEALASLISNDELRADYVIPSPFDPRVVKAVSQAVASKAIETGFIRKP